MVCYMCVYCYHVIIIFCYKVGKIQKKKKKKKKTKTKQNVKLVIGQAFD